jgi:hypothetical protein
VFLGLEQDGKVAPAFAYPIKCETDLGVWSSADSQIRSIPETIQRIDADLARMDQDEAQINAALDRPWEQAERYAWMQAELEALNAELAQVQENDAATTESATDMTHVPLVDNAGTLEVVAVSDAERLEDDGAMPVMLALLLPPVALPAPSDPAAMQAAMARLATLDAVVVEEEPIEAEIELAVGQAVEEIAQSEVVEPMQPLAVTLYQEDVIQLPRASRSTLVFGSIEHIRRVKGKKPAKAATTPMTTTDMFAAEPASPQQLALSLF